MFRGRFKMFSNLTVCSFYFILTSVQLFFISLSAVTFCPLTMVNGTALYTTNTPGVLMTSTSVTECALMCTENPRCTEVNYTKTSQMCALFYAPPKYNAAQMTSNYFVYRVSTIYIVYYIYITKIVGFIHVE